MPSSEWDRCAPWIAAAAKHSQGVYEVEDVRKAVEDGEAVFWPGESAAVVTQFVENPRGRFLLFWMAGGDLAELRRMHDAICEWGAAQGCVRSLIIGRQGWARALDYEPVWTTMMKEL